METDSPKHIESLVSLSKAAATGTTDSTTQFWEKYSEEAEEYDKDFLEKNRNNMESVLIFAGLFSAVAAGFLVAMQATLSPNPTDTTNALLMMLVHSSNNTAFSDQPYVVPAWAGPRSSDVWSQAIGYAGLSASLLAALGAVLGKQWLTDFTRRRRGPLQERGRRRQQKLDGLQKWQFEVVMGALPALIQLALLLFGIALSINLWQLNRAVGSVVIAATTVGASLYLLFTIASLISPTCPFHTPVSSTIQEVIAIVMRSLEETCQYWAWCSSDMVHKPLRISPANKLLAYLPALVTLPLVALGSVILATISIACGPILLLVLGIWWLQVRRPHHRVGEDFNALVCWFQGQVAISRRKLHTTACLVRDAARHIRDFIYRIYLDPQPDPQVSDSSAIAWLLETSNHPDVLMSAAMLVPEAKWPEDLDLSLPTQHLCNIFIRSISEKGSMHERALTLGKAFVIMLCQESQDVSPHVWHETLRDLQRVSGNLIDPDRDCDLPFILTVITKLLYLKSNLDPRLVEFSTEHPVSQSLLTWFLQPLQILLQPGDPRRPHFFPEVHRVFLKLDWTEGTKLSVMQQVQYCRVFEVYLSGIGLPTDKLDNSRSAEREQDPIREQVDILSRILIKLQQASDPLPQDAHQEFLVPLTVISMLSGAPHLKHAFEGKGVESWALNAFASAVRGATGTSDKANWLFASSLLQLASQASGTDASDSSKSQEERDDTKLDERKRPQSVSPPTVDFDSLLAYLLNKVGPVSAEQAAYAFKIMLVNTDDLTSLVHRPDFINYVVNTTGPGQVYSIRDMGLKVLFASCDSLLRTYGQPEDLLSLASHCNLARFIHRALLSQDPPSTLIYLLDQNDDALNEILLRILSASLGDPFTVLLNKLRTEPNRIPERDLRDFEMTLILAKANRKKLSDHLERSIETIRKSRSHEMALALTVTVGWLLRPGGPAISSQSLKQQLLRPGMEGLLVPAWRDPDALEESPQMIRLLLVCTSEWLATTCRSPLPLRALNELEKALHELTSNTRMLSADIKRSLQKTSREIKDLRVAEEGSRLRVNEF